MTIRKFKALEHGNIINKVVVYDNNGNQIDCSIIHKNKEGKEYYYSSNPYDEYGLFTDKPKDMIECIKSGLGDTIMRSRILGMVVEHVVRFIDREYGEILRQQTLKGWKNTKFGYAVKFQYLNSLDSGRLICKDKSLVCNKDDEILTFDTEEEASTFINEINEKGKGYFNEYIELEKEGKDSAEFFNRMENEIENCIFSVYWYVFSALNKEKDEGCPQYILKIVQTPISKKNEV